MTDLTDVITTAQFHDAVSIGRFVKTSPREGLLIFFASRRCWPPARGHTRSPYHEVDEETGGLLRAWS